MTLSLLLKHAMLAIDRGERVSLHGFDYSTKPSLSFKKNHEIVTRTDLDTNKAIIQFLRKATPSIPVISEEGGDLDPNKISVVDEAWVLDPIDGTSNFSIRLPLWGISLGYVREGKPALGVITLPALKQRYHAIASKGAWLGKKRLHVSDTSQLKEGTGLLCYGYTNRQREIGLKVIQKFSTISQTVRRLGAAVIEATWIASGRADYAILNGVHSWDVAAGTLLVREAGGKVLRPDGEEWNFEDENIVFTTPRIANQIIRVIKTTRGK